MVKKSFNLIKEERVLKGMMISGLTASKYKYENFDVRFNERKMFMKKGLVFGVLLFLCLMLLDYIRLLSIIFNEMQTQKYTSLLGIVAMSTVSENEITTSFSFSTRTFVVILAICMISMAVGSIANKKKDVA